MQRVVRSDGMVHLTLPSTEEGKSNHKTEFNGVDETMASRLAALTKVLKERIPHKNGVIGTPMKPRETKTEAKPTSVNGLTLSNGVHTKESSTDFIAKHCKGMLKKTTSRLSVSQCSIERRVTESLHTLRCQQLAMSHTHSMNQLDPQHPPLQSESLTPESHRVQDSSSDNTPPSCSTTDTSASFSMQKHLQSLGSFVDDEATCSSSDEEEDELLLHRKQRFKQSKLNSVKQKWEKDRAHIGSQWAWLCHQITSVNQKIYQLDTLLQSAPPKEGMQFVPHMSGLTTQQMQVKDILGYSLPALLMEESSQTCARTRMLRRAPKRKVLRAKRKRPTVTDIQCSGRTIDLSYHPFLSQANDLSSSLWLDKAVHQILQEHSYASLPVQKKWKITSAALIDQALSHLSSSLRLERSKSFSPSPTPLDLSIERIGKGVSRKRSSTHSYSDDSNHVTTPTLPRKRKSTTTPQYDIDNIIIPYSMASSTRLEKLEYKEIITPKWQEKLYPSVNGSNGEKIEQEDVTDAMVQERHAKCEEKEKKRYLFYMGGNGSTHGRKRPRLSNTSTPEPPNVHHLEHDVKTFMQVLPFPPRKFPLVSKELTALDKPGPPPKKIV